jgi:ElaA protein
MEYLQISITSFQHLTVNQLYDILQLRSEIFVVEQNCVYNDLDGLDKEAYHLLMEFDNRPIGTARILPGGSRFAQVSIGRVVVHKEFRGRNYGKILMKTAIGHAREKWDNPEIKISAQLYLKKFYEDLGFRKVTDIYDEDGIPHIGMILLP